MKRFLSFSILLFIPHFIFSQSYIKIDTFRFSLERSKEGNTWRPVNSNYRLISIPVHDTDSTKKRMMTDSNPPYLEYGVIVGKLLDRLTQIPGFADSLSISSDLLLESSINLVLDNKPCRILGFEAWLIGTETIFFESFELPYNNIFKFILEKVEKKPKDFRRIILTKFRFEKEMSTYTLAIPIECIIK